MSYTVCNVLDLGEAYTGVTLNAQLYDSSNSTVGSAITTGFYERSGGKGIYTFTMSVPDGHQGWFDVYVNGASSDILATLPINPAEVDLNALADAILSRSRSHSDGSAEDGSLYEAVGILTQSETSGTTLTVYESDGTTPFNTRTLTLDSNAEPVTGIA